MRRLRWVVLALALGILVATVWRIGPARIVERDSGRPAKADASPKMASLKPASRKGTREELHELQIGRHEAREYRAWAKAAVRRDPVGAWRAAITLEAKSRAKYFAQLLLTELAAFDDETLERLVAAGEFGELNVRQVLKEGLGHQHARDVTLRLWEDSDDVAVRQGLLLALAEYDAYLGRDKLATMDDTNVGARSLYEAVSAALVRENLTEALQWARSLDGWQADTVWLEIGSSLAWQLGKARPIDSLEPLVRTVPGERQLAIFERFLDGGVSGPQEDFPAFLALAESVRPEDQEAARSLVLQKYGSRMEVVENHVSPEALSASELTVLSTAYATASPSLAFRWAQGIDDFSARELASARTLQRWLREDSQAAGATVLALNAGRPRDLLAGEVITHLVSKQSFEEAQDWIDYVGDSALRAQYAALLDR